MLQHGCVTIMKTVLEMGLIARAIRTLKIVDQVSVQLSLPPVATVITAFDAPVVVAARYRRPHTFPP
jgi:hypothetical protein